MNQNIQIEGCSVMEIYVYFGSVILV